jgi:hypothetical protein
MDYRSTLASVSDSLSQAGQSLFLAAGALGDILIELFLALFREVTARPVGAALFFLFYIAYRFLFWGLGPVPRRGLARRYGVPSRPLDLMRHTLPGGLFFLLGFGLFWWTQPTLLGSLTRVLVVAGGFGFVLLGCRFYRSAAAAAREAAEALPAPGPPAPNPAKAARYIDPLEGTERRRVWSGSAVPILRVVLPLGLVAAGLMVVFSSLGSFSEYIAAERDLGHSERRAAVANLDDSLGDVVSVLRNALRSSGSPTEQAQLPVR